MTEQVAPATPTRPRRAASGPPEPRASAAALWVRRRIVEGLRRLQPAGELHRSLARPLGLVVGLMATALMMLRLYVPSTVGMADTGIGHRLLCALGLANYRPGDYEAFTGFIHPRWEPATWFGEACVPSSDIPPFSAHFGLVRLAQLLTGVLGGGAFDTRVFAVVASALFGILIGLLVVFLPGSAPFRLAVAAGVALVMADGVFADFFVSAFADGTVLLAVLASLVALLVFWRSLTTTTAALVIAAILACAALTVSPILLAMVPAFLVALLHQRRPPPRGGVHRPSARVGRVRLVARAVVVRTPTVLTAALIVAVATMQLIFLANRNNVEYLYTVVFQVILPTSETPVDDAAWLGLPESAVAASGSFYGSEVSRRMLDDAGFASTVTVPSVVWFFVTHPERLVEMSDRGFLAMASPGLDYLGSYLPDTGHEEGDKEHRVPVVEFSAGLFKAIPLLIPGLHLFALVLGFALALRRGASAGYRAVGGAIVVLIPASWLMFWTILFGAQPELSRNLLPVALITALLVPLTAAAVLLLAASTRQPVKSASLDPMPKNSRTAARARSLARPSP